MNRRKFLTTTAIAGALSSAFDSRAQQPKPEKGQTPPADLTQAPGFRPGSFELDEVTVSDLQDRMRKGASSSERIAQFYLERIDEIDRRGPALRSVIEINPEALAIARALDAEYKAKGPRGPLHGIPVLLKDNIDTADNMQTTAGSLALAGKPATRDSWVAGALASGGSTDSRQDQSQRVGKLSLHAFNQRLERPRRSNQESLRARSQPVRLEFRFRSRCLR